MCHLFKSIKQNNGLTFNYYSEQPVDLSKGKDQFPTTCKLVILVTNEAKDTISSIDIESKKTFIFAEEQNFIGSIFSTPKTIRHDVSISNVELKKHQDRTKSFTVSYLFIAGEVAPNVTLGDGLEDITKIASESKVNLYAKGKTFKNLTLNGSTYLSAENCQINIAYCGLLTEFNLDNSHVKVDELVLKNTNNTLNIHLKNKSSLNCNFASIDNASFNIENHSTFTSQEIYGNKLKLTINKQSTLKGERTTLYDSNIQLFDQSEIHSSHDINGTELNISIQNSRMEAKKIAAIRSKVSIKGDAAEMKANEIFITHDEQNILSPDIIVVEGGKVIATDSLQSVNCIELQGQKTFVETKNLSSNDMKILDGAKAKSTNYLSCPKILLGENSELMVSEEKQLRVIKITDQGGKITVLEK